MATTLSSTLASSNYKLNNKDLSGIRRLLAQIELMPRMHKMNDFFGEMKKFNADLGAIVGTEYAECYWQHLGGGFQKDPFGQEELSAHIKHRKRRRPQ